LYFLINFITQYLGLNSRIYFTSEHLECAGEQEIFEFLSKMNHTPIIREENFIIS